VDGGDFSTQRDLIIVELVGLLVTNDKAFVIGFCSLSLSLSIS
jgi:hypothetical protein